MSDLSPKARALIDASRPALRPSAADCERVEAALRARLGSAALPDAASSGLASSTATWKVGALAAAIGVCLLGAVALRVWPSEASAPAPSPTASIRPPAVEPETPAPTIDVPPSAAAPAPAIKTKPRPRSAAVAQDQLALEVEILSRATSALHAGEAALALKALEEHERKFPHGSLRQERSAAKAQALCSLGRVRESRAELERLPPNAPATIRARQQCGL